MDSPIRVLLVDENAEVLDVTEHFLASENDDFTVTGVESADEALERLEDGAVDAVVTDYRMPGTDGLALTAAVHERAPDVPVVLFTGADTAELDREMADSNLVGVVRKRAGTEQYAELAAMIRDAVGG